MLSTLGVVEPSNPPQYGNLVEMLLKAPLLEAPPGATSMPDIYRTFMVYTLLITCSSPSEPAVCELDGLVCNAGFTSDHQCEYEEAIVAEPSCNRCQARLGLYEELCDQGSTETLQEVGAGIVCTNVNN